MPAKTANQKRIDQAVRREAWRDQGLCVDCGGEVVLKQDETPSTRCKDHFRTNSAHGRSRIPEALTNDDSTVDHFDHHEFADYMQLVGKAVQHARDIGATTRFIHEQLGTAARPEWTLDALRLLKSEHRLREGHSIAITRWFALDEIPASVSSLITNDPSPGAADPDEYDEVLRYAQQSSFAEAA